MHHTVHIYELANKNHTTRNILQGARYQMLAEQLLCPCKCNNGHLADGMVQVSIADDVISQPQVS